MTGFDANGSPVEEPVPSAEEPTDEQLTYWEHLAAVECAELIPLRAQARLLREATNRLTAALRARRSRP